MNFTLTHSHQQPHSLKQLLISNNIAYDIKHEFAVTITLDNNVHLELEDDLIAWNNCDTTPHIKQMLSFILHEGSELNYHMKIAPQRLDQKAENSHIATTIEKTIQLKLVGKNAQAKVVCACFGHKNDTFKFNTLQDHHAENATSSVLVKGVLDDASKLICNSMIIIQKNAQKTNAEQANKNILLSKKARTISIPQLEIEANDVKCKHGAAVSQLNNDHIFYLQSRGLALTEAKQTLINAFLS